MYLLTNKRMKTTVVLTKCHYDKALEIATEAHKGQERWGGDPYIIHPVRVAERMATWTEKIVAILHDVVEDTPVSLADLSEHFPPIIIEAIDAISRRENELYFVYIHRCSCNNLARKVKIADLFDNMEDNCKSHTHLRYQKALEILIMNFYFLKKIENDKNENQKMSALRGYLETGNRLRFQLSAL